MAMGAKRDRVKRQRAGENLRRTCFILSFYSLIYNIHTYFRELARERERMQKILNDLGKLRGGARGTT